MKRESILAVIPARAGSKGIPGKNTKELGGWPLILHSLQFARLFLPDDQIFISTDDPHIQHLAQRANFNIPYLRPAELSTDTASTFEVLQQVIQTNQRAGSPWKGIWLLQPTSPFRLKKHGTDFLEKIQQNPEDAWVSAVPAKHHPWFTLFKEEQGKLVRFLEGPSATRRQDCPPALALNGSMYWFPTQPLLNATKLDDFPAIHPYLMEDLFSLDLDVPRDWLYAEWLWQTFRSELRDW